MVFHYTMLYKVLPNLDTLLLQTLESGCRGHFSNARLDTSPSYRDSTRTTVAPKRKRRNDKLVLETERQRDGEREGESNVQNATQHHVSIDRIGRSIGLGRLHKTPPKNPPQKTYFLQLNFGLTPSLAHAFFKGEPSPNCPDLPLCVSLTFAPPPPPPNMNRSVVLAREIGRVSGSTNAFDATMTATTKRDVLSNLRVKIL